MTTSWQRDGGRTLLSVVVTPDDDDFHLYSVDHVPADHRGLGIATSLSVEGGWTSVGRPVASVAVVPVVIEELDVELPVYPNGQVEFLLEVSEVDDGGVDLVMTFGLCSDQLCLIPVRDVHIELTRP